MENTGAEFGAVSTPGLIQRAKRKAKESKDAIDAARFMTRARKAREKQAVDKMVADLEAYWAKVQSGNGSEEMLRAIIVGLLDPNVSGGSRKSQFRW